MIARVGIDSEALMDFEQEPRRAANIQGDLVEVLVDYGYFELLGARDLDALLTAVKQLGPSLRELWSQALNDLQTLNRIRVGADDAEMRDLCSAERLPCGLTDQLDLVVIRESLAAIRGVPLETGHVKRGSQPEISLSDSVRRSSTVQGLRDQRLHGVFPKGAERESVWRDLLVHVARLSKEATILDRYFLTHLLAKKGQGNRDHHRWLLQKLNQSMEPGATVRVLSELPVTGKAADGSQVRTSSAAAGQALEASLAPLVRTGRISELQVVLAPWPSRWDDGPHNRHIRFGSGIALCTYEGLDYLDRSSLQSPFTWQAATSPTRLGELTSSEQVILSSRERMELRFQKPAEDAARVASVGSS